MERNMELLTLRQVAELLLVDATTVRRWIRSGALDAVTLPAPKGARRQSYRVAKQTLDLLLTPSTVSDVSTSTSTNQVVTTL